MKRLRFLIIKKKKLIQIRHKVHNTQNKQYYNWSSQTVCGSKHNDDSNGCAKKLLRHRIYLFSRHFEKKKLHEVKQISPLPKSKREQKISQCDKESWRDAKSSSQTIPKNKIQTRKYARSQWCFPAIGTYLGKLNTRLIPLSWDHNAQSVSSGNLINYWSIL